MCVHMGFAINYLQTPSWSLLNMFIAFHTHAHTHTIREMSYHFHFISDRELTRIKPEVAAPVGTLKSKAAKFREVCLAKILVSRCFKNPPPLASKHRRDFDVCAVRWFHLVGIWVQAWGHTRMHLGSFHTRGPVHLSRTVFCLLLALLISCLALGDFCQQQLNHWQVKYSLSTWSYSGACFWHGVAEFPLIIIFFFH